MDKQAVAKWRLYALANRGHAAATALGGSARLPEPDTFYSGGSFANIAEASSHVRGAIHSYLQNNPRLARKMGRFLRENPSVKRPSHLYNSEQNPARRSLSFSLRGGIAQGPGGATPIYGDMTGRAGWSPYMRDFESAGVVKSAPTPHEPYRKEFFRMPPEAFDTSTKYVDVSKAVPTGVPLTVNTDVNKAVAHHMAFNRHGSTGAGPKVKMVDFSTTQPSKNGVEHALKVNSPAYSPALDTVYMPNVAGMHRLKGNIAYDKLMGRDIGLPARNALRGILGHELDGHGMLYRENADYLSRLARKSSMLISRSLNGTPYSYTGKNSGGIVLGEFMANYHAANPGSALRERSVAMFDRPVRNRFFAQFNRNMNGLDPDVVARTKSGLQQVWDNYHAVSSPNFDVLRNALLGMTQKARPRVIHLPNARQSGATV